MKWYCEARQFKSGNEIEAAELLYQKIVRISRDSQLIGKAWFHLRELSLKKNRQDEALERMKNAVRFCFNHTLAFAFLALLIRCANNTETPGRNRKPDHGFLEFFKPANITKMSTTAAQSL